MYRYIYYIYIIPPEVFLNNIEYFLLFSAIDTALTYSCVPHLYNYPYLIPYLTLSPPSVKTSLARGQV